jgi:histidinol-phosphate phosphatase family protein
MSRDGTAAVFLDRDGVIIRELPGHVLSPEDVDLIPGAAEAIARLHRAGHLVMVVTNQSAVGRGLLTLAKLEAIHSRLRDRIRREGGEITEFLVCPHLPEAGCPCRKPRPGLLIQACGQLGIDLRSSFMVGDQTVDMEAARLAGYHAILVLSGQTSTAPTSPVGIDHVADDLAGAADFILAHSPGNARPEPPSPARRDASDG